MKVLKLHEIKLEQEIIDKENMFRIGYCAEIENYVAIVLQAWIVCYERWYIISQDDYEYYIKDRAGFLQQQRWISKNYIGSSAIRDYDCRSDITRILPYSDNPFQGHVFMYGALWAHINTGEEVLLIPPKRLSVGGYPFREIEGVRLFEMEIEGSRQPLCYCFLESEILK